MADTIRKLGQATVKVTCSTEGAKILCKIDSGSEFEYTAPSVTYFNCTFQARATKADMLDSDVASVNIEVQLPKPTLSAQNNGDSATVTITNKSSYKVYSNFKFRYTTDGSAPTAESSEVPASGLVVSENCTVKVAAIGTDNVASEVASIEVSTVKVATPIITVE